MVMLTTHDDISNNDNVMQQINSYDSIPSAFEAAHDADVTKTNELLSGEASLLSMSFYMISCRWMESVCEYLQGRSSERPMVAIDNSELLLENGQLHLPMVYGVDYYLIGSHTWMLLSSKFGFDVELKRPVQVTASGEYVVHLAPNLDIDIPPHGKFECGMSIGYSMTPTRNRSSSDIVSEEEEEEENDDELFQPVSENSIVSSEPVLMLPPSTTTTAAATLHHQEDTKIYHAKGLGNLGNTCFMNSTLQCLAHTHPLRRYFLSDAYMQDLNRDNPLGAQGELATEFSKLLQEMWSDNNSTSNSYNTRSAYRFQTYNTVYPRSFKTTLGRHAEQFLGYDQHDSHELATYLLDALHEDTNRVTKKPYVEKPEQLEHESDDVAAAKAWSAHLQREDSRVLEQFVGLVKSRVQCPVESCGRVSTTFDPFMYLSVPIPGATDRTLDIIFVPLNPNQRHQKLHVTLSKTASMLTLQKAVCNVLSSMEYSDLEAHDICLADVWSNEVYHFHKPKDEIDKIRDTDQTYAFQLRSVSSIQQESTEEDDVDMSWYTSGGTYHFSHGPKLPQDILDKFESDDDQDWIELLEPMVRKPTMFFNMFNPRRLHERLPEIIEFLFKLEGFIEMLHSCHDAKTEDDDDMEQEQHDEAKTTIKISMEERCASSGAFRNVRTVQDLGVLECCAVKIKSFITESLREKLNENKDGIIIQIGFQRKPPANKWTPHSSYSSMSSSDKTFTLPLAMRIPPTMTVYELRQEISKRLGRCIRNSQVVDAPIMMEDPVPPEQDATTEEEMSTATTASAVPEDQDLADVNIVEKNTEAVSDLSDVPIMNLIPLTYDNKSNEYSSYKASDRTLGMLSVSHDDFVKQFRQADPNHPDEQQKVCDVVSQGGSVCVHWPKELSEERFDLKEYETVEEWKPPASQEDESVKTRSAKKTPTVFDCIERYCAMEQLEDSEMWYCSRCKEHVRAWKQFHLYRAPPILIIHLKRFHYSATTHRRDKIDTYIDFPLEGLDLTKEVMQWTEEEKPIYDLYAVSNHFGGLGGGHYTAYALSDDGKWCNFDDSRVTTDVDPDEVKSSAAYVLYYRRRDVEVDHGVDVTTIPPITETMDDTPAIVQDHETATDYDDEMSTTRQTLMYSDDDAEPPALNDIASDFGSNSVGSRNMDEEEPNYFDQNDTGYLYGQSNDNDYPLQ